MYTRRNEHASKPNTGSVGFWVALVAVLLVAVALAVSLALTLRDDESKSDIETKIRDTRAAMLRSYAAADFNSMVQYYTGNSIIMASGETPQVGRSKLEQDFLNLFNVVGVKRIDSTILELEIAESEGFAMTREQFKIFDAAGTLLDTGSAVLFWKKVGDQWLVQWDIFNSDVSSK